MPEAPHNGPLDALVYQSAVKILVTLVAVYIREI